MAFQIYIRKSIFDEIRYYRIIIKTASDFEWSKHYCTHENGGKNTHTQQKDRSYFDFKSKMIIYYRTFAISIFLKLP